MRHHPSSLVALCCFGLMNYAQDRLDRKARDGSIWHDVQIAHGLLKKYENDMFDNDHQQGTIRNNVCDDNAVPSSVDHNAHRPVVCVSRNHTRLATCARNLGWNRHAVYHAAQHWQTKPHCPAAAADYAQMAELAGFPAVGLVALLVTASMTTMANHEDDGTDTTTALRPPDPVPVQPSNRVHDRRWIEQSADDILHSDCGCGAPECGASPCSIPWRSHHATAGIAALESYLASDRCAITSNSTTGNSNPTHVDAIPTAHVLLGWLGDRKPVDLSESVQPPIPAILQFWKQNDSASTTLWPPAVQCLFLKLLYQVVPQLAMEAIVYCTFDKRTEQRLAREQKSHWAYVVFLKALVLGERIKAHRRLARPYHHEPLWDRLWNVPYPARDTTTIATTTSAPATSSAKKTAAAFASALSKELSMLDLHDDHSARDILHPQPLPSLTWIAPTLIRSDDSTQHHHHRSLYILGDSHVLSLAWQTLVLDGGKSFRLLVPVVTTGLKAWHVRSQTRFFTRTCLTTVLQRLPRDVQTICVSAGEIDCREGLGGPLLEGYTESCLGHVQNTVAAYVVALKEILEQSDMLEQILVLPVAPHLASRKKGRVAGQVSRRETMRVWNDALRTVLQPEPRLFYLDYTDALQAPDIESYSLHPIFNADSTHMNAAFAPLFQKAVDACGCRLDLV